MARPMTAAEKTRFHGYFPLLNVNAAIVTDNATRVYNCISWTVGVTNAWLWPGSALANFDAFYARYGLFRMSSGPVAAWGLSPTQMTHGSISGPSHGPRWESKCGSDLRIQHGLNELISSSYGHVIAFYARRRGKLASKEALAAQGFTMGRVRLGSEERKRLAALAEGVSGEVRQQFERFFEAWKRTWFSGHLAISSDPGSRLHSAEFHELVSLGPRILPLLVQKLAEPDNFIALGLYDALQAEHTLLVPHDPADDRITEGEQGRARAVVQAYLRHR